MMLKVGELAKRSGLTVRALHHYDSIGLLSPSVRSDAGYRLYGRNDIARLHQIQALRRFGVPLADIGTFLASPGARLSTIVEQQISALTRQIDQAGLLREQLKRLRSQLAAGEEPELAAWLTTLELMTMYDKYFSKDELARLPFFTNETAVNREWAALVARMQGLIDAGIPASSPEAQKLAQHWMIMLERDTGGDPGFLVRINAMQEQEPRMREQTGLTAEMDEYVMAAVAESRIALYAKHLTPEETAFMRANYTKRAREWPALIAQVRKQVDSGAAPSDPASRALALQWMDLFKSYAGDDPATHMKIRAAHEKEPGLMSGTFVTDDLLAFIGQAIASR